MNRVASPMRVSPKFHPQNLDRSRGSIHSQERRPSLMETSPKRSVHDKDGDGAARPFMHKSEPALTSDLEKDEPKKHEEKPQKKSRRKNRSASGVRSEALSDSSAQ